MSDEEWRPLPGWEDTRHLDGDPSNNRADNLTYGNRKQNMADAVAMGRTKKNFEQLTLF